MENPPLILPSPPTAQSEPLAYIVCAPARCLRFNPNVLSLQEAVLGCWTRSPNAAAEEEVLTMVIKFQQEGRSVLPVHTQIE